MSAQIEHKIKLTDLIFSYLIHLNIQIFQKNIEFLIILIIPRIAKIRNFYPNIVISTPNIAKDLLIR